MNPALIFSIAELALQILKSQTSNNVDDKIDEATALGRIVLAGRQAYLDQTGMPLDESLIKPQPPLA